MKNRGENIAGIAVLLLSAQALSQVTFYEGAGFRGRAFTADTNVQDFTRSGFNDRASSVVVDNGRWEVCEHASFRGRCVVLQQGAYDSLERMGINDRISSVRRVRGGGRHRNEAPQPLATANYDYRRRSNERVYEAEVTSVHAVVGQADQHCWMERSQVEQGRGPRNVTGGVVGAVIGGIIGHQIGNGRGNDAATAGGAIAGAVIGSNQGRGSSTSRPADVRRCETVANTTPDYWDVSYRFRDVDHRVQMTEPPGRTVYVNDNGEPRQ
jgi:uncharacterized protein YcfJ